MGTIVLNETIHAQQRTFREGAHHLALTYKLNDAAMLRIQNALRTWQLVDLSRSISVPRYMLMWCYVTCDEQT